MARVLEMVFNTEMGSTKTMRIADAKDPLTSAEVSTAMDTIINKNIFKGSGGELVGKIKAQVVVTTTNDLALI
jgi:hypothetical protein